MMRQVLYAIGIWQFVQFHPMIIIYEQVFVLNTGKQLVWMQKSSISDLLFQVDLQFQIFASPIHNSCVA